MNKLKSLLLVAVAALSIAVSASAQTAVTSTTLAAAVTTVDANTVLVASATGFTAGTTGLYVDREFMLVTAVNGTTISVVRGANSTAGATHLSGAAVFVGPLSRGPFVSVDKSGSCTSTNEAYLPVFNVLTGKQFDCKNSKWLEADFGLATLPNIISGSGATATLTTEQSGSLIMLDRAAGIVFTLPAPVVGLTYEFLASVSVTSNAYKFSTATQGTDFIVGDYVSVDTDTASALVGFPCNGSTHDNFSMNGTTTGGLIGTRLKLTAISTTVWAISGFNEGNGVVATACSTT